MPGDVLRLSLAELGLCGATHAEGAAASIVEGLGFSGTGQVLHLP